jgi:hypothetical protein
LERRQVGVAEKLKMSNNKDTLLHHQYKHICYCFETAFALAIEPRKNMTMNPMMEWQLHYFGED